MTQHSYTVDAAAAGKRLDKWLSAHSDFSRSRLQALIAQGCLSCNGAPATNPSQKTIAGDHYQLQVPDTQPLALTPVPMNLDIVFEDEALIVINKPAGLTVHPASSTGDEPTLVHGLLAHCGDSLSGIGGVARPGIVHRLDKDTSGLILIAKNDVAHQHLSDQLKDRSLSRTYHALLWGVPSPLSGCVDAAIGRHPRHRTRMAVVEGGKPARTHYSITDIYRKDGQDVPVACAVTCKLESGRTHQIRVHMAHLGCPVMADPLYGKGSAEFSRRHRLTEHEPLQQTLQACNRQALHAFAVAFVHPLTGEEKHFTAPLPDEITNLSECLNSLA